jgi:sugar phosphate isomerase/epimerase
MRQDQIGLELYTVRTVAKDDFLGTLRKVAEIGYPAVEFAGLHDHSPEEVRATLDESGLKAPSAHVAFARLQADPIAVCDELQTLGCEFAVVPWIGPEHRANLESARRFIAALTEVGKQVRERGLRFGYHNHDFEFAPLEGPGSATMWDLLLDESDPAIIELQLDFYWVTYGGGDPAALVSQAPERYPLLHFKDMTGEGDARKDAPIGTGSIRFESLVAATANTTEWYIVEQDVPADPMTDIATSLQGMQRLVG